MVNSEPCERYVYYGEEWEFPWEQPRPTPWDNTLLVDMTYAGPEYFGVWDTPWVAFLMVGVADGTATFGATPAGWTKLAESEVSDASAQEGDPGRSMVVYYRVMEAESYLYEVFTITCTTTSGLDPGPMVGHYTSHRIIDNDVLTTAQDSVIVSSEAATTTGDGSFAFPRYNPGWAHAVNTFYLVWAVAYDPTPGAVGNVPGFDDVPHGWTYSTISYTDGGSTHTLTGNDPGIAWLFALAPTEALAIGDFGEEGWGTFNPYQNTLRWLGVMTAIRTTACPLNDATWGDDTDYGVWGEFMFDNDNY